MVETLNLYKKFRTRIEHIRERDANNNRNRYSFSSPLEYNPKQSSLRNLERMAEEKMIPLSLADVLIINKEILRGRKLNQHNCETVLDEFSEKFYHPGNKEYNN